MARALDTGSGGVWLEDIDFRRLLAIDSKRVIDADLECDPSAGRFGVFAGERGGDERALHACGRLAWVDPDPDEQRVDVGAIQRRLGAGRATPEGLYASMRRVGLEYGPQFRTIASAFGPGPGDGQPEVLVRLQLPENVGDGADYLVHPALLDGSFQAALSLIAEGSESRPWVPVAIERVRFCAPPRRSAWAHVRLQRRSAREAELEVTLADDDGRVCLALSGVSIQPMVAGEVRERADGLFSYAWQPLGDGAKPRAVPVWLAGEPDDTRPLAAALAAHSSARVEASRLSGPGAFGEVPPDVERVAIVVPDERRRPAELAETLGAHIAALAGALARRPSPPSLVVIATGGDRSGSRLAGEALAGLLRVVRAEAPELEARCVFASHPGDAPWDAIAAELLRPDAEPEIRLSANGREGRRLVRREIDAAAPRPAAPVRTSEAAVELAIDRPGAMGTIHHRMSQRRAPGRGELEIRVEAAALNFKDVLKLAGQLDPRAVRDTFFGDSLGMECVGVVERAGAGAHGFEPGDRVMALPPGGCFRSFLTCHASTVGRLPCDLSPTAGAGLVIPYLTAWHSLLEVARIEPGETVLVHHASGGVGFAAIQVARLRSARVIATAGTEEKRAFVRSLGVQHVSDSRSLAFVDDVRRATGGRGVDVVLGAMAGDMLVQSLRLLARYGRCIDIGKRAQIEDADLPLRAFNEALTYAAIDMDRRLRDRPAACMKVIGEILETIETGKLPAVPVQVVAAERAADAFRTMAQARHVGRLVLDYDDRPVEARAHPATGDTPIRRDATYVVTGGLGGFGLEVARWLAEKGAGALVLIGRRGLETPGAAAAVEALEARGARVIAAAIDVADEAALRRELSAARAALPPIRGVFHGAMVLDDHRLDEMTAAAFARVLRPKAQGAWNLHTVTESDPIEHFVAFSSVAVAVGNPGQSNYVTANAFLDGLMAQRRREGKPGTSIQWGVLGDVGVALRTGVHEQLEAAGMVPLSTDEALSALEQAICGRLARDDARLGVFELDWQRFAARAPQASQPLFSKLGGGRSSLSSPRVRAAVGLLSAPPEARTDLVTRELAERAGEVLRMEAAQIGAERSLAELGVDSLGAVEIATALAAGGYPLTEMDLMTGEPINSLAERATARLYATLAEHRAALLASDDALTDEQRGRLVELAPATEERP
jgi:NADPH:quinone reductase-like Zn-dependent oxidoreductase/NADP-dependent 3-hydroxy acid dehydrogenase YdfG